MPARTPGRRRALHVAALPAVAALGLAGLVVSPPAQALTDHTTANGANVFINDARRPGLDTGSIRNVTGSRLEAFGSLFVHVDAPTGREPRMNDQMMRGFGLTATSPGSYRSTRAVRLGDVLVTRKVQVATATDTTSFFDTFTNTSTEPVALEVSFGGSLGSGYTTPASGLASPNKATVTATGSGDAVVDPTDAWIAATTPTIPGTGGRPDTQTRPTGVVVGTDVTRLGDQQSNPFETAYVPTGSRSNDVGFVRELTVAPGATASLVQYVVVGDLGDTTQIVSETAALATTPDFSHLSVDELCTVQNWTLTPAQESACVGAEPLQLPAADPEVAPTTDVAYDVTGKTIADLQADMAAGRVTSVEITKAYLDRIEAYDDGAWGFHAFITVAKDAVAQAMAADRARAAGRTGDLLGVPVALKDLYDTKDMPTSGGTLALKDWEPKKDAWQVARLRDAGAVIIGKTNLSEFANSGSFSESGFKQTWNALYPSKTSFGSSGGSATAVGADLAAAAMGTQTGVSLYAPSTGASLSTFRGTDGLTSTNGVMPLTWATDYAGPMTKSVTDLAIMLDATATRTTGNDPADLLTSRVDNAKRPVEWKSALRTTALQGRTIGYVPTAFVSTAIADDNAGAVALAQAEAAIEAAGGTLVALPAGAPTAPAAPPSNGFPQGVSAGAEGWERYIAEERPAAFPLTTEQLMESPANLPYNRAANYTTQPLSDAQVETLLTNRDTYKVNADTWMDTAFGQPVDAVVYPGFLTSVGNNDASSAIMSSDRASGVITQGIGLPTAILPIGRNDEGQSNNIQIVGRAWEDTSVLGYGYAIEQQTKAAMHTEFAPDLPWSGPAPSVTALTLGDTATTYGTAATAAVTVAADPAATGSVSVEVAGTTVTGTLVGGTATLSLPTTVPVGTHLVTARYAGSATVAASAATATLKVARAAPKVAVKLPRATVKKGKKATLKVTVGAPATVLVYDGNDVVRTVRVERTKSVMLPKLAVGKHRLRAYVVAGDDHLATWSRKVTLTVRK
jgi:amidase